MHFPIFYDVNNKRWPWIKWSIVVVFFVIMIFLVFTIYDVSRESHFDEQASIIEKEKIKPSTSDNKVATIQNTSSIPALAQDESLQDNIQSKDYTSRSIAFYVNWDAASYRSLQKNIHLIDELIPEWLHLDNVDGSIVVDNIDIQNKTQEFIDGSDAEIKISPLINNYNSRTQSWDQDLIVGMLQNPEARTHNIQIILRYIKEYQLDGINIDFESIPDTSQKDLILYMKELHETFSAEGLEVSQSIPLIDDSFDAHTLANYTDFLILMAYDEYVVGSSSAGPIASGEWFESGVKGRFSQISPKKTVIAYGNYGYDWAGESVDGKSVTVPEAMNLADDAGISVQLDQESKNEAFSYIDYNDVTHHVWFLDAVTAFNQIASIDQYQPLGYALWRLGGEDPSLWDVVQHRDDLGQLVADVIMVIPKRNVIDYSGKGEILKVEQIPSDGVRDVMYNPESNSIIDASILMYPSAYRINRYGGDNEKKIALTFDDGPDAKYTEQILDILKQNNVPATFFTIGLNVSKYSDILKRIAVEGHEIGSHTFTHPNISHISPKHFFLELNSFQKILQGNTGRKTVLFRPPYAEDVEPETPEQIDALLLANNQGYYTVGMHIDPKDWAQPGVEEIVSRVIDGARSKKGNIVLLHDSGGNRDQTVAALPLIIDSLKNEGYELVLISELAGVSHDVVMPPITAQERFSNSMNAATFSIAQSFSQFFQILFKVGIFLGIARLIFISVLALVQAFKRRKNGLKKFEPKVDVIVPAWNEESVIERTIESLLYSDYRSFQIIVVDDGSTDDTYKILQKKYSQNENVSIFTKENGGKASALNYGIEKSSAPFIVALDADTLFTKDTIKMLMHNLSDVQVGAVAGNTRVGNKVNILTKLQALEYITSQNLERRAAETMNVITVVSGAVGAWRREVVLGVGGFSQDTLAEDADLTFSIIQEGYKVIYEDSAIAYTEAPDTVRNFNKQRFRWMYGTLQTGWKHREVLFRPRYGALGFFALPNIFIFQLFFQLIAPFIDLVLVISLAWALWQNYVHQVDYDSMYAFRFIFFYYILFLMIEVTAAVVAFALEKKPKDWSLLIWIIFQRFFYRQLLYYTAVKTIYTAAKGVFVGWGKFERKNTSTIE